MPYIEDKRHRGIIDRVIDNFVKLWLRPGYVNYFLFKLAKKTCKNYSEYRDFLGELEAAKLEIYRRQIIPYEDKKIKENGDV